MNINCKFTCILNKYKFYLTFLNIHNFSEGTTDKLKENLIDDLDYVLLPTEAWKKLAAWYSTLPNQEAIKRKVVEYGMFVKHCKVEVYLMELKLSEHGNPENYVSHQFSKADTIGEFRRAACTGWKHIIAKPSFLFVKFYNRVYSGKLNLLLITTFCIYTCTGLGHNVVVLAM